MHRETRTDFTQNSCLSVSLKAALPLSCQTKYTMCPCPSAAFSTNRTSQPQTISAPQFQASAKYVAEIEFFEPSLRPVVSCPDPLFGRIEMPVEFRPCLKNVVRGTREKCFSCPSNLAASSDDPAFSALNDSLGMAMAAACQLPGPNRVS
jgi:hypothetical protein